jgi:hypothetical protein
VGGTENACFWDAMTLMIEAVSTSETSVNFYETSQHNISEDNNVHTRRRENPKFYLDGTGSASRLGIYGAGPLVFD